MYLSVFQQKFLNFALERFERLLIFVHTNFVSSGDELSANQRYLHKCVILR